MRVCVTGAAGRIGRHAVSQLREDGHEVVAVDLEARADPIMAGPGKVLGADLTEFAEAAEAVHGCDAVVHLANVPAPGLRPDAATFNENMAMNFNVFHAAARFGVPRVVWASSETTLGVPFDRATPPRYAPLDEDHYPHPRMTYALSKVASETIAAEIAVWSETSFVALRFSNVFLPEEYSEVAAMRENPPSRAWNLWAYIDARDAAAACRAALAAEIDGSEAFIIVAADTLMTIPSAELLAETFPGCELRRSLGERESLLAGDRARERLGFEPRHGWRDAV